MVPEVRQLKIGMPMTVFPTLFLSANKRLNCLRVFWKRKQGKCFLYLFLYFFSVYARRKISFLSDAWLFDSLKKTSTIITALCRYMFVDFHALLYSLWHCQSNRKLTFHVGNFFFPEQNIFGDILSDFLWRLSNKWYLVMCHLKTQERIPSFIVWFTPN